MTRFNWQFAAAVAVLIFAMIAGLLATDPDQFCVPDRLAAAAKEQNTVLFNCFEFWFNRYQSLIGSIITAAVAGVTLLVVFGQLSAADKQAAVMAASALRTRGMELEEIVQQISKARSPTHMLDEMLLANAGVTEFHQRLDNELGRYGAFANFLHNRVRIRREIPEIAVPYEELLDALNAFEFMASAYLFGDHVIKGTTTVTEAAHEMRKVRDHLTDRMLAFNGIVNRALGTNWAAIRALEAKAVS